MDVISIHSPMQNHIQTIAKVILVEGIKRPVYVDECDLF